MPEETTSPLSFEKSLEELERTVKELEKGDLPLERSLALFESGMRLSAECKKLLEEAESRVEVLTKRGSDMIAVPYNPDKQLNDEDASPTVANSTIRLSRRTSASHR